MDFFIECKTSGAGEDFHGSLSDAIEWARMQLWHPTGVNIIWHGQQRVAEVRQFSEWVSSAWKEFV